LSLIALALSVFVPQSADPWDRAESALHAAKGLTAKMTATIGGERVTGSIRLRSPDLVDVRLVGASLNFEYRQSPKASIYIDHRAKSYQWWPWYPEAMPPPTTPQALQLSFPQFLMQGSLKSLGPKSGWSTVRNEKVGQVDADVISLAASAGHPTSLWIDARGRVLKQETAFRQQEGELKITLEFEDVAYTLIPDSAFAIQLPAGYEAEAAPRISDTAVVGQRVKLTEGLRLPEEAPEDLSTLGAVAPVMVVVTSDDLEPSPDGDAWPKLWAAAKKKGLTFVQIWVGQKPKAQKADWLQFWDKSGSLEQRLGPPVTPYIYVIEKGTVVSGWQGRIGNRLAEVQEALFEPFSKKDD